MEIVAVNTCEILEIFLKDQKNKQETVSKVQDFELEANGDSGSALRGVPSLSGFGRREIFLTYLVLSVPYKSIFPYSL
jgi:hypothetical protein